MVDLETQLLERLARVSTAKLHDAGLGTKVLPCELRPVWPGANVAGRAFTVTQAPGDNVWLHRAIYAAPAGSVIVTSTGTAHGYWGELMSRAAIERGVTGLVIDGAVRDVEALEALPFAVFASGTCPRRTGKDPGCPGAIGEPITLGSTHVRSGDVVVGDADGAIAIPAANLDATLDRAEVREADEEAIRQALLEGRRLMDLVVPTEPRDRGEPS